MIRWMPLLLLAACASPQHPWRVEGASWPEAADYVRRAIEVTGDRRGHLKAGGVIYVMAEQEQLNARCGFKWDRPASGCAEPGEIVVLHRLASAVLPHELCHLGLWGKQNFFGPVDLPTEAECDRCAAEVLK